MPAASILVKPASSACNIACGYCFYRTLSARRAVPDAGLMSHETLRALTENALAYGTGYTTFAFQGGEPTLCGLAFYEQAVRLQHELRRPGQVVENSLQTNGLLLDEAWAEFLAREDFLVGLSLDGPQSIHDANRVDMRGQGTHGRVLQAAALLRAHGVRFNVLSVVTDETCAHAAELYAFYKENGFSYVQLIGCLDEEQGTTTDGARAGGRAVNAEAYGRFLCELFDLWYADFMAGQDMDVRMFSNLAQLAAGYPAEECGMSGRCTCYFAVEADGSVYPCDFYCTDAWKLGTVHEPFATLAASEAAREFVRASTSQAPQCRACPWFALCRGGCRRWRDAGGAQGCGLNRLCPAYQRFFGHTWERLQALGRLIVSHHGPWTPANVFT